MKVKTRFIFAIIFLITGTCAFIRAHETKSPLLESWEQYLKLKKNSEFGLEWISLGPVMNAARVEAIQLDSAKPGTMYVAFGSGNLWKTTNSGLTWKPIFENQSALGIGDIALAPSNPDIIWLGSGESLKKARNFTMPGTGVFRSNDGGQTWRNVGLHDSYHIGEITVHPENPDIVFVAVLGHFWSTNKNRGLYRSIDGGETWEHVLYVNEHTGANDVVIAPSNPDIIYASMWENNPGIYGKESGIYKSTDGGKTWVRLIKGLPEGSKTGRIGLAVSWSNPDKVYALVDNLNKDRNTASEVYRTLDGGESWERTHKSELYIFPGIGWYFADCYVNPQNDEEVFALGVRMAHSTDGGKTFRLIGGDIFHFFPNPADFLHLDHCELWINPLNPSHLALGNDGGFYVSYDKGESWMHYNNIPAGEFYDISVDNQDPYYVYGGVQDDSSVFGLAREWNPKYPDGWKYVWLDAWAGGDGCFTLPDPEDSNTVYFSMQYGAVRRKDMRKDRSVRIRPQLPKEHPGRLAYTFVTPYFISPHNRLTLYHAANYVFKSLNRGDSWNLVSPDLSKSSHKEKTSRAIGAIAESPMKPGLLYAGTDRGAFWVTQNDGIEWTEHSEGLPNRYIRFICPSRFSQSRVYTAVTGINDDDLNNYIFMSEDYGKTWKSITSNLPNEVAYVILEDPLKENILYAGMYRGVYVSVDCGQSWSLLGPSLAATCISDLVIQEREMDLVVGTHGRGIYKMNISPIQEAFKNGNPQSHILFKTPVARLPWINDTHRDPRYSTVEKVPITFYLMNEAVVTLNVKDKKGRIVWSRNLEAQRGFNQVRWDLITKKVDSPRPYFVNYYRFASPGIYEIQVSGEGIDLKGGLSIIHRESPDL
ncbi:MAG: hypothetical protein JSV96_18585 [Candidatus Aminicenantes bacterium]|nr:MAG: hypothetical protein JSV96_18585 [Candidatus Aminicenantes bacterium]